MNVGGNKNLQSVGEKRRLYGKVGKAMHSFFLKNHPSGSGGKDWKELDPNARRFWRSMASRALRAAERAESK